MRNVLSSTSLIALACLVVAMTYPADAPALVGIKAADVPKGRDLSRRFCSNCHVVAPNEDLRVVRAGPGFKEIANRDGQTAERTVGGMIIPHPDMPTVSLTNREIRDIVGYIMSLKTGQ